ncbi:hypothetical protein NFI96_021068 [Prochilodus magdalenae]|nr:hypothetical protein NFI96_021068 [Prochilodus magdalenae]
MLNSEDELDEFDLRKYDPSEECLLRLLPVIKASRKSILAGCNLTTTAWEKLSSALQTPNSFLKELDLSNNDLQDSGVELLSAGLKSSHCNLETLRVDHGGEIRLKPGLKKYFCEFTLDPNTKNGELTLSDGDKKVTQGVKKQYPYHPERFDIFGQVLGRESVSGRCYWEAEWTDGCHEIVMAYKSISRNGGSLDCRFGANRKSWRLSCSNHRYHVAHNYISTEVSLPPSGSKRVGVYLDHPAGILSYYSVSSNPHTLTHLHTFHTTFTEPLHVGFTLCCSEPDCSVRICELE